MPKAHFHIGPWEGRVIALPPRINHPAIIELTIMDPHVPQAKPGKIALSAETTVYRYVLEKAVRAARNRPVEVHYRLSTKQSPRSPSWEDAVG